ncbi:Lipoate-protein ligase B [Gloeomargarita lithophora Alchichica-D10]|uniref:Octanoyltransferase n=1 Tax=Gloeomargarita lithophora Alchichica-D10 TaxID=1188229 RepID=A0A1J0AD89_9CYAN|nr:lipoyl(octanoyl) transferase LipB [Gloeomargarita lithophora]APB33883.1 Lipoate-protein ligase B [Gloeomargarita lithophora Alchichica-D10]
MRIIHVVPWARVPYPQAWAWQKAQVQQRLDTPELPDILALLEHEPVYTLGQGASLDFLRFPLGSMGIPVYRTERGGEVTYHGPGQVVGYPILRLKHYGLDVHQYLRCLEQAIINVMQEYRIPGERKLGYTGVWVGDTKVAAIGIKVRRGVTMHGFALNVCTDLTAFDRIVPCGIRGYGVGNLGQFCPDIDLGAVRAGLVHTLGAVLGADMEQGDTISIRC